MNEADVTKTHTAKIDALNELAASLIRSGAPVDAVQKFVDAGIDRIEFMQGKTDEQARLPSVRDRKARQFRSKRIKENGPGIPWEGFLEQEEQAVDFLTLPSTHDHAQTNE